LISDWTAILARVNQACPCKSKDNPTWLVCRIRAESDDERRFRLLAEAGPGEESGYAASVAGEKPDWLRVFLVVKPGHLGSVEKPRDPRSEKERMRLKTACIRLPGGQVIAVIEKELDGYGNG
jgi:hypothetical protein